MAAAGLCLLAGSVAWAGQESAPPSEKEWQDALAAIRDVALNANEAETCRANAVVAYVKLLVLRNRHDDALGFCREVLKSADKRAVLDAALRGGCLIERERHGHLGAAIDFVAACSQGASHEAAAAVGRDLDHAVRTMAALAARMMVPEPVVPRFPQWASAGGAEGPGALRFTMPQIQPPGWYRFRVGEAPPMFHVTLPKMEPPSWYGHVAFPPLKEPKK